MKKFSIITLAIALVFMVSAPSFAGGNANANANANASSIGVGSQNQGQTAITSGNTSGNQGQAQSNKTDVDIKFPDPKDETTLNNKGTGYRGFANPADINYPVLPSYFGTPTPGSSFQGLNALIAYKHLFSTEELILMAKSAMGSKVIVTPLVKEVAEDDRAEIMSISLSRPNTKAKVTLVGYITVKATSNGTVSAEVMAEAMLAARKLGADTVHATSEGVERVMQAFGWGVGFSYTKATMNGSETAGGVAAGGTGISGGTAGYKDRPWIQLFALRIDG